MAKKKPRQNNDVIVTSGSGEQTEASIEPVTEKPATLSPPPTTFESQVAQILEMQAKRQAITDKRIEQLTTMVTNMTQQKDTERETPKQQTPMDMVKMITDILNGPIGNILNKIVDSIGAPEQPQALPEAASSSMVTPAEVKRVNEYNEQMAKYQMDMASEMVRSIRVKNDMMEKESRAEF